ncbi:hypothetical protein HanIR_Chr13g0648641 [Helianthus annuus]|nr:hypothetical protein HanIR_Chr13g0648641 [Helianthus annuus]
MAVRLFSIIKLVLLIVVLKPVLMNEILDLNDGDGYGDDLLGRLFRQDYSPPAPPPPPPHPPSASCQDDLGGVGKGNFYVLPNVTVNCSFVAGCEFGVNVSGNFTLGENARISVGSLS